MERAAFVRCQGFKGEQLCLATDASTAVAKDVTQSTSGETRGKKLRASLKKRE